MSFSTQLRELAIAYGLTAVAMLIGLVLMRADRRAYFRWPVYSAMAMTLGVVSWNLLRKHLLPEAWNVTHANALYYCALALYFVIGIGLGLLLGRLTGRTTAVESKSSTE
jgi:formate-dependent nitrite reductase membrane component NrfD